MKRLIVALMAIAALLLAGSLARRDNVEASNPGQPQPLLGCADVNGDTRSNIIDIAYEVSKFGTSYPQASFHPLYDIGAGDSRVDIIDIAYAVSDFGLTCPLVDTQVARATLAILNDPQAAQFLTENPSFLATRGYFRSGPDAPGQGIHYISASLWDGVFSSLEPPYLPEGLVYNNGRLVAHLTFANGDGVGWGPEPPPPDQVNTDAFCTPVPPNTSCSWAGSEDGFHWHADICFVAIGSAQAMVTRTESAAQCEQIHNTQCGGAKCPNTAWFWDDRIGWMGHLWNHDKVNRNGRFADCAPDETGNWKGFNCPQ